MSEFVYLVEAENGLIKIGRSQDPCRRFQTLSTQAPILTRLIAYFPGWIEEERALHVECATQRAWGEWFRNVGPVTRLVESRWGQGVGAVRPWGFTTPERSHAEAMKGQAIKMRAHWANPVRRSAFLTALGRQPIAVASKPSQQPNPSA